MGIRGKIKKLVKAAKPFCGTLRLENGATHTNEDLPGLLKALEGEPDGS